MVGSPASASQAPTGGLDDTIHLDGLLQELRRGERDAFVGYFQLFRAQVYGFALHLLGDETAAVAATTEAFVGAFREIILDEDATDLRVVTFRQALDACVDRAGGRAEGAPADGARRGEAPPAHGRPLGGIVVLTGAALDSMDMRRRAALLLHDVHGLDIVQTAAVFSVTTEAAGAQLFRARETFQQALAARATDLPGGTCRQAEQAAAGAVGQGLGDDELRRLRRHTAYCRTCRAVMKGWGGAPIGLAVLIKSPPVPQALAMAPVFGGGAPAGEAALAAGTGPLGRILWPVGRVLRSRSAAYVVAAACIALAIGVAFHQQDVRRFVLTESVGPAIRLVIAPPAEARAAGEGPGRAEGFRAAVTERLAGRGRSGGRRAAAHRGLAARGPGAVRRRRSCRHSGRRLGHGDGICARRRVCRGRLVGCGRERERQGRSPGREGPARGDQARWPPCPADARDSRRRSSQPPGRRRPEGACRACRPQPSSVGQDLRGACVPRQQPSRAGRTPPGARRARVTSTPRRTAEDARRDG